MPLLSQSKGGTAVDERLCCDLQEELTVMSHGTVVACMDG